MLLLNAGHLLGNVSLDESGIVPFEFAAAAGGHELGCVVEFVRDLLVGRGFGPVRGEDVVGLATQKQGVHPPRSEEHTSELQSLTNLVCRLLLEKKKKRT